MTRRKGWQERDPQFAAEQGRYAEPIPSRELILSELLELQAPVDVAALARRFGLRKHPLIDGLDKRIAAMVRDGTVHRDRHGKFSAAREGQGSGGGDLTGRVIAHRDGYGWFQPQDGSGDLHLDARQMAGVMHGDRLRVKLTADDGRGQRSGAVLEVLERGTHELAGRFEDKGDIGVVVPDNPRLRQRLVIPAQNRGVARHGDLVVAQILEHGGADASPIGSIVRVLETHNAADLAAELAVVTHGLPREWPAEALREAQAWGGAVKESDYEGREDLRELPLVTIDGEDARDFDDAVYCEPVKGSGKNGGWRLVVAIADVSHYVRAGGALDREALARATSVYFPDRVIPMLPETLSNELCSLKPRVERLALVCDMRVDTAGEVGKARFYPAVFRSAERFTYTQVAAILIGNDATLRERFAPRVAQLENLHAVYRALRLARQKRGALDFDAPEVKIRLDAKGSVAGLDVHSRNDAHRLIEECMIAANIEAARFLTKQRLPTLFRVHGEPEERRVSELQRMLRALGIGVRFPDTIGTRELEQVVKLIAGRPDAAFIETLLIRSLPQAVYQPTNIGHFGLGLTEYAHFTSPIRRYPDLLVHRAIHYACANPAGRRGRGGGGADAQYSYSTPDMERLGVECSTKERRADMASRDVLAYLKCDYMRAHVGDEFEAVITSVVDFGLFVQLANLQIDGLVHVSSLRDDYYVQESARCAWVGRRTRRTYQLGQRVTVRLKQVDMAERKLDFEMVVGLEPATAQGPPGKSGASKSGAAPSGGGRASRKFSKPSSSGKKKKRRR